MLPLGCGRRDVVLGGRVVGSIEPNGIVVLGGVWGEVEFGDRAVGVLGDAGVVVCGEPFLGGDGGFGLSVGVTFGEQVLGLVGFRARFGGVGPPDRAGIVQLLQVLDPIVENAGERCGFGSFLSEPCCLVRVSGGDGFGGAQGGGVVLLGRGLAGPCEVVANVAGSPRLFAFPGDDPGP